MKKSRWMHSFLIFFVLFLAKNTEAQSLLTLEEAINTALDNNFTIKITETSLEIADNNQSIFNTGQLPTVTANAGANGQVNNASTTLQDGRVIEANWGESAGVNGSVALGYTIFDGFFRRNNIQLLQEQYQLTELQLQAVMESIVAQTMQRYFQVATLQSAIDIWQEVLQVSNQRLEREQVKIEFGQGNELSILNAQVDLNNDSLSLKNAQYQLENAKRQLNRIMVTTDINYQVEDDFDFLPQLLLSDLRQKAIDSNTDLQLAQKNIQLSAIQIDLAHARKLPSITTDLSYAANFNQNNPASFVSSSSSNGLQLGINLRWNIFDGGTTRIAEENAKLSLAQSNLEREQLENDVLNDLETAYADYLNTLDIYQTEVKNLATSEANFERSREQLKVGQINSVDYRQAQLNLIRSENNVISNKLQVKIAEIQLLLLAGSLVD